MKWLGYILTYSLIWLLHLLPERILFLLSDLLYFLMYHVAGYRKKVVFENLRNSFPEYDQAKITDIAKKFYRHLSDLFLESTVIHFYSEKEIEERMHYVNPELVTNIHNSGKQIMAVMGHYGNWEYLLTMKQATGYTMVGIYKPLANKYFERMVHRNREVYGGILIPMEKIARRLLEFNREGKMVTTAFLSDQSPIFSRIQYWTEFLGQDTPVYLGAEKLAKKLDAPVIFAKIRKTARGRYSTEFVLLCDKPGEMEGHSITDAHVKMLEEQIREAPEYWLWSHRRWKHSYERYQELRGN